ncbi:MAG: 30S ribosomal protein S17 [Candidatus Colwellbacteria bacterium]|nr:30S ribosomal protein S17 [Candidatus Colwellbacteria bacterium]
MNQETQKITTKRRLEGVVVSDKMQKTVVVNVARFRKHPKYQKYYKVSRRFKAHDENNEYKTGDKVIIEEMRPLSKGKRWKVIGLVSGERHAKPELANNHPAPLSP